MGSKEKMFYFVSNFLIVAGLALVAVGSATENMGLHILGTTIIIILLSVSIILKVKNGQ